MPAYISPLNPRYIGFIIPDIVLEEVSTDQLMITENPVEVGTPVADHAYKRPVEIILRCGWSDSTHRSQNYVGEIYNQLLALQVQAEPFDVITPKRQYITMLISSLVVTTDQDSEYILNCIVGCKQVIITTSGGFEGASSGSAATQSDPSQTSRVDSSGAASPQFQSIGPNSVIQFGQVGGLSTVTSPGLGSIPGQGFAGVPLT